MDLSALTEPKLGRAVPTQRGECCFDSMRAREPIWPPRRTFVPAFPRGTPPSDQLWGFIAGKQILPYLMPGTKCRRAAWCSWWPQDVDPMRREPSWDPRAWRSSWPKSSARSSPGFG